jgi:hypothetical protein
VLAFALFGSLRYTPERLRRLIRALVAGIAAVCLIGLVSRVLPHAWPTASSFFANRLNYPLTYWNAEGMLAMMALILGFHLSADRAEHWSVRVIAAALLPGVAATLLLTFSRGALGVTIVGLLAYCLLTRLSTLPTALLAFALPIAIALRSAWDATLLASTKPTSAAAVLEGHHVAVVVGACMLGAGLLRGALLFADRAIAEMGLVRTPPPRAVRASVGATAAVIVVALRSSHAPSPALSSRPRRPGRPAPFNPPSRLDLPTEAAWPRRRRGPLRTPQPTDGGARTKPARPCGSDGRDMWRAAPTRPAPIGLALAGLTQTVLAKIHPTRRASTPPSTLTPGGGRRGARAAGAFRRSRCPAKARRRSRACSPRPAKTPN